MNYYYNFTHILPSIILYLKLFDKIEDSKIYINLNR